MIRFIQKDFTEYEAMRPLYVELLKNRVRFETCDSNSLIPILKGNNVVIERFVKNGKTFGKDNYRMYLKLGAKVKLPEHIKLSGEYTERNTLFKGNLGINGGLPRRKLFGKSGGNNNNNNNQYQGGGDGGQWLKSSFNKEYYIGTEKTHLLGEVILYDKKERSVVFEFKTIENAVRSLNILPFGLNYKLYLLDA